MEFGWRKNINSSLDFKKVGLKNQSDIEKGRINQG
jgi:hypothetical protein